MTESKTTRSKAGRRQTLTAVRSPVRDKILEGGPDARITFTKRSASCRGGPHHWKLWRRVHAEVREVHIDHCGICRRWRVEDAGRRRSESTRSVYVRRTLFYRTTRQDEPDHKGSLTKQRGRQPRPDAACATRL